MDPFVRDSEISKGLQRSLSVVCYEVGYKQHKVAFYIRDTDYVRCSNSDVREVLVTGRSEILNFTVCAADGMGSPGTVSLRSLLRPGHRVSPAADGIGSPGTVSLRSLLRPGHRVSPETILLGKFQILDWVTGLLGQFGSLCDWVTWSPGHYLLTRLKNATNCRLCQMS